MSPVHVSDGIAVLTIAKDDAPFVDLERLNALRAETERLAANSDLRVMVVRGGAKHFCSGAPKSLLTAPDAAQQLATLTAGLPRLWLDFPVPVIAAMQGHAVGGGLMTGLWCDHIVLSERSLYGANFTALGFTPGMGATVALADWFGRPLAQEMMYTGKLWKGRELLARAPLLFGRVLPHDAVFDAALALAADIAAVYPVAVRALKQMQSKQQLLRLDAALALETPAHNMLLARADVRRHVGRAHPQKDSS